MRHSAAIGEAVHITSDEWLTWNQIYDIVAAKMGVEAIKVHVPSDVIARHDPGWGASLLGDKTNSAIFDNSKVKALVPGFACTIPFAWGAEEIVNYYLEDPSRGRFEENQNALEDLLTGMFGG